MNTADETNERETASKDDATRRDAYIGLTIGGAILVVAVILSSVSGFGPYEGTSMEARAPTLWDWMELLIVPAVLALGALWFNKTQKDTELNIAEKARTAEREIAEKARTADREIAEVRQRQATLEGYFDRMTDLLLMHSLGEAEANDKERSIARARTVAVVQRLDSDRNQQLFAFLRASKLIGAGANTVDLSNTDFRTANLRGTDLAGIDLQSANLREANLREANLEGTNLSRTDLSGANLEGANLEGANLKGAKLTGANLTGAFMRKADMSRAFYHGRSKYTYALTYYPDWFNLDWYDLRMDNVFAGGAVDLSSANLSRAFLKGANLNGAKGWTIEQLERAWSLEGAIMPDEVRLKGEHTEGPTFEEWKAKYLAKR